MTTTPPVRPATLTYSQTPPALPPADRSNKGALVVTVLSAYDLTCAQQPMAVSMNVAGATARTGPPSARHKDRNSYRFVTSQVLRVDAPLATLYKSKATFTLEYKNPRDNLTAELVCQSIHIHETQWLILNLEPMLSSKTNTSTTTTTTTTSMTSNNSSDDDSSSSQIIPTLRLQVRLEGPYRTEIAALVSACNAWFRTMDSATDATAQVTKRLPVVLLPLSPKYLLIPGVPIMTAAVVLSPILVGILVVGLPVFLPILVAVLGVLAGVGLIGGILVASTKSGRKQIGSTLSPMYHTLLSTPSGQRLVYETGPRPTPVSIAQSFLPTDLWKKLVVSLLIDAIGSATYLLPVVGEVADLAWAPLQTILIMAMYDTVSPNLKYVSFVEEILPFTDVVPSATIGWVTEFGPQLIGPALGGGNTASSEGSDAVTQMVASLASSAVAARTSMNGGTVAAASRPNAAAAASASQSSS